MGTFRAFCGLCFITVITASVYGNFSDEEDSIVIEADPSEDQFRTGRQIHYLEPYQPELKQTSSGPCLTSKGVLGKCVSFRQCYPNREISGLGNIETWLLGMYETCSYFSVQGRQVLGVCCITPLQVDDSSPQAPSSDDSTNSTTSDLTKQIQVPHIPSNWPPPIPTHPPDHTIPPLPTHPPSSGHPAVPTVKPPANWPPTTKRPPGVAWPPTSKPPAAAWPPTNKPSTWPPISKPTTEAPTTPVDASCGAKNGYQDQERIVGGHNADVGEWPWIAALFNGGRQFCGGSLIDSTHILSAAHCVAHMSSWDVARLTVRLGDHNIRTNSEVRHIEKKVKRVVRHRGFDSRTLYHDIAILTLDSPVQFSHQIRPVCLPGAASDYTGQTATVIGWGSLRESGPQPAVLQEVNIPIWSNNDCRLKYGPAAPGGIVEHMVCAGQASKDSCSGDSGGPLMINNGRWTQVGIVSWGIGCGKGQYPGVYTRVEKFLSWIYKNLK